MLVAEISLLTVTVCPTEGGQAPMTVTVCPAEGGQAPMTVTGNVTGPLVPVTGTKVSVPRTAGMDSVADEEGSTSLPLVIETWPS